MRWARKVAYIAVVMIEDSNLRCYFGPQDGALVRVMSHDALKNCLVVCYFNFG